MRSITPSENHNTAASLFKEFILGGQDGLVNVLGIILGVAIATQDPRLVIIAGLSATVAESVSMGAVAYTSAKAEEDYYQSQKRIEEQEVETIPEQEKREIYDLYYHKGFRGKLLNQIVEKIISNKKRWVDVMMKEELNLTKENTSAIKSAIIVFFASAIGSLIPLTSFFLLPIKNAIFYSLIISAFALFITGAVQAKMTIGNWLKKGAQLMLIGMLAAGAGFLVGKLTGYS